MLLLGWLGTFSESKKGSPRIPATLTNGPLARKGGYVQPIQPLNLEEREKHSVADPGCKQSNMKPPPPSSRHLCSYPDELQCFPALQDFSISQFKGELILNKRLAL